VKLSQRCRGQAGGGQGDECVYPCCFLCVWMRLHHSVTSTLAFILPFLVLASEFQSLIRSAVPAKAIICAQPHLLIRCCHFLPQANPKQKAREGPFQLLNVAALWPHSWLSCSMGRDPRVQRNTSCPVAADHASLLFRLHFTSLHLHKSRYLYSNN
jgi:hypothetical protein